MSAEESNTVPVAARINRNVEKGVRTVLQTDGYLNTSDYIRDLIRKDLEKRGL